MEKQQELKQKSACLSKMLAVRDTLDVINGKWKVMILVSIEHGNSRFKDIERSIPKITSKVLAKELKDLEEHKLIVRTVYDDTPVIIEYTTTAYSRTLGKVMNELYNWGVNHRKKIMAESHN